MQQVLQAFFGSKSDGIKVENLTTGRINDSYRLETEHGAVILQRINSHVFTAPEIVADNFYKVSNHLQIKKEICPWWKTADSIDTVSGDKYYRDEEGQVWRCQSFLELGLPPQITSQTLVEMGKVLGTFHLLLSDFNSAQLANPLPGFHHLPSYLQDYKDCDTASLDLSDSERCIEFVSKYEKDALVLHEAVVDGKVDMFVIHADPKMDNFVFDDSGKAVGLIDLDTVYKGSLYIDIGDSLRSLCGNNGGELDLNICESFLRGYLGVTGNTLMRNGGREYIFSGIFTLAYELGVRFLTDHLAGDIYFKVSKRGENLTRAKTQLNLAESIIENQSELKKMSMQL